MERFLIRIKYIDQVNFVTANLVNRCQKHFQKINFSIQKQDDGTLTDSYYCLSSHLENDEKEIEFLRKLSHLLLHVFLPKYYTNNIPLHTLLREICSVQILFNSINFICDPDYINQKIFEYFKWLTSENEKRRKVYAYAETYEEFIKMINKCNDVDDLKRMKYYIVNEIMQATVINNLKKERGIDYKRQMFCGPSTSTKGDHLQSRDLKRYLNQLRFAKNQCEKRIKMIGGSNYDSSFLTESLYPNKKTVLAFKIIVKSDLCRSFFRKFLQYSVDCSSSQFESSKYLLLYWESVEQLKKQEIDMQYKIANDILKNYNFISSINCHVKVPKRVLKGMQEFILGNKGPDSFFEVQTKVYEVLEHRYYPLFVISKEYDQLLNELSENFDNLQYDFDEENTRKSSSDYLNIDECDECSNSTIDSKSNTIDVLVKQTKQTLKMNTQKLKDKQNALNALMKIVEEKGNILSSNTDVDSKLIQMLEKEIEEINKKVKKLEYHLEWTTLWLKYIGEWRAEVQHLEFDSKSNSYSFVIIVYNCSGESSSSGWVITRTQDQIIGFRTKLISKFSNITRIQFPKFRKNQQLNTIKNQLQVFFDNLTSDKIISKTEELFIFFSQREQPNSKTSSLQTRIQPMKLPFANFFGITNDKPIIHNFNIDDYDYDNDEDEQIQVDKKLLFLDENESKSNTKDDIAEPLYNLANEIFELSGVFNLLRRTLITFVQITYGKTINRHLLETVEWIFSESIIQYYLSLFKDSMWPNGEFAKPWPERTEKEKKQTQLLAKQYLLSNIPEFAINFLGHQNAKKGVAKVFDAFQDKNLNKQLCYVRFYKLLLLI